MVNLELIGAPEWLKKKQCNAQLIRSYRSDFAVRKKEHKKQFNRRLERNVRLLIFRSCSPTPSTLQEWVNTQEIIHHVVKMMDKLEM